MICNAGFGVEGAAGDVQLHPEPPPGGGRPQRDARRAARLRRRHRRPGRRHQEPPHVIHPSTHLATELGACVRRPWPLDRSIEHALADPMLVLFFLESFALFGSFG